MSSWKYCFEVLQYFDKFDTLLVFGSVDGERWKSEVYEEQRCLQRRLLQLHSVSSLCQCGKLKIHLIIASSISSVYSLIFELYLFFFTDKVKTSILSGHGKNQPAAGCPVPLPHVPAHQKETQVRCYFCCLNSRLVPVVIIVNLLKRQELLVKNIQFHYVL